MKSTLKRESKVSEIVCLRRVCGQFLFCLVFNFFLRFLFFSLFEKKIKLGASQVENGESTSAVVLQVIKNHMARMRVQKILFSVVLHGKRHQCHLEIFYVFWGGHWRCLRAQGWKDFSFHSKYSNFSSLRLNYNSFFTKLFFDMRICLSHLHLRFGCGWQSLVGLLQTAVGCLCELIWGYSQKSEKSQNKKNKFFMLTK